MWLTIKYYRSILSKQHAKSINAFSISASKVCEFAEPFKCYCGTLSSKQQNIVLSNLQMATLILCSSIPLTFSVLYANIFFNFQWQKMVSNPLEDALLLCSVTFVSFGFHLQPTPNLFGKKRLCCCCCKLVMAKNGARVHLKTATQLEEKEQHQYIHHEPA